MLRGVRLVKRSIPPRHQHHQPPTTSSSSSSGADTAVAAAAEDGVLSWKQFLAGFMNTTQSKDINRSMLTPVDLFARKLQQYQHLADSESESRANIYRSADDLNSSLWHMYKAALMSPTTPASGIPRALISSYMTLIVHIEAPHSSIDRLEAVVRDSGIVDLNPVEINAFISAWRKCGLQDAPYRCIDMAMRSKILCKTLALALGSERKRSALCLAVGRTLAMYSNDQDVHLLGVLLQALADARLPWQAISLYLRFRSAGKNLPTQFPISADTYRNLLYVLGLIRLKRHVRLRKKPSQAKPPGLRWAEAIFNEAIQLYPEDSRLYSRMLRIAINCNNHILIQSLLKRVGEKNLRLRRRDMFELVVYYFRVRKYHLGKSSFEALLHSGSQDDKKLWDSLIRGLCYAKRWGMLIKAIKTMRRLNIVPSIWAYEFAVPAMYEAKGTSLARIEKLIRFMSEDSYVISGRILEIHLEILGVEAPTTVRRTHESLYRDLLD